MYRFNISAPGTIFLHGDAVLGYQGRRIVAAVDKRIKLEFASLPPKVVLEEHIRIKFMSLNLQLDIPLNAFFQHFYNQNGIRKFSRYNLINKIKDFLGSLNIYDSSYDPSNTAQYLSLQAFLYLLLFMARKENIEITASIIVQISSDLAIGRGLGSSATFVTCLAACFWRWSLLQKGTVRYEFNKDDYEKIKYYAWKGEKIIYNNQNSISLFVSVYGVVSIFKDNINAAAMDEMRPMKILLIDSNIDQKEKAEQMENIFHLSLCVELIMTSIKNITFTSSVAISEIYLKCLEILNNRNDTNWSRLLPLDSYKRLSTFINMNQGLLRAMGMSSPNIDFICAIARKYSLASKLISDSGFAFIFLLPNTNHQLIINLTNELKSYNFPVIKTTMVCTGVRVE
ncbi:mevalonate kinase-like isoform X1 [Pogonomyrmex barbatus]|uniref:Mevalonate kinase-like isoform X1 n=1 Tax=Pogonomyrmex barbatus TaxID=144034 RepID=A0A8N1S7V6_9HYME|nr:mevalonate kinase-like isoform X1 [Pogonomyrmex barbatus]